MVLLLMLLQIILLAHLKLKVKKTGQTSNGGTKSVEIMVPLKYLSNFWRTFKMPLMN